MCGITATATADVALVCDSFVRQAAEGVVYLHGRGVVHNDIKPSNILLVQEGPRVVAKVADLGLATSE